MSVTNIVTDCLKKKVRRSRFAVIQRKTGKKYIFRTTPNTFSNKKNRFSFKEFYERM